MENILHSYAHFLDIDNLSNFLVGIFNFHFSNYYDSNKIYIIV